MKSFKILAFMILVGIGQTLICSEEYKKRRDAYEQKLVRQLRESIERRVVSPSMVGAIFSSKKQKEFVDAVCHETFNILHQEEFQHCPNNIFTKFFKSPTPECSVVRECIADSLKYDPKLPNALEMYEKSRAQFYAARKAANL